jgi:cell wall-associated NlpC family hydrolase
VGGTSVRVVVASLLLTLSMGAGTAVAVPPPPPNPSDDQISGGKAAADAKANRVGQLTNQVAQVEAQLAQLDADVELKMEDANRAFLDLQTARDAAAQAKVDADAARLEADTAARDITEARAALDDFAAGSYRQGSTIGSMSAYIGSKSPEDLLARAQLLEAVASNQLDALDTMELARTEKANKDSAARQALDVANQKQADAMAAKDAADRAAAAAEQAQDGQAAIAQQLQAQKDAAESELAAAQANATGLQNQRQQYLEWVKAKQAEEAAQNQPPPPGNGGGGGGGGGPAPPPNSGGVQAVIDRALSQLGVPYAWGGGNIHGPTRGFGPGADTIGFDCSGLMIYAFHAAGKRLPH